MILLVIVVTGLDFIRFLFVDKKCFVEGVDEKCILTAGGRFLRVQGSPIKIVTAAFRLCGWAALDLCPRVACVAAGPSSHLQLSSFSCILTFLTASWQPQLRSHRHGVLTVLRTSYDFSLRAGSPDVTSSCQFMSYLLR